MSKLGVSSQSGIIQDASKVLAKHPIAWKLFGNALSLDFARKIHAESPSTLIILRAQPDNWALDAAFTNSYIDRATRAAEPFQSIVPQDKLLLEPPNEPIIQNIDDAKLLNELQVTVAHAYYSRGFTPLGYQFPVGNPDYSLWQYLEDGLLACDGWIGLHEYGAPTLQSHAEDLSLRHRKVYANYLSPAAKAKLKIVITECALDFGILTTRTLPDGFPTAGGYRAMPQINDDEDYWIKSLTSQLNWWDAELAKDPYVIATTIFGYAMEHPWETFDVSAIDTDRTYWINQYQGGIAVIPPYIPPISTSTSSSISLSSSPSPSPSPSLPPLGETMIPYQSYQLPQSLVDHGWQGQESFPSGSVETNEPFYRLQPKAGFLDGVSAFVRITVLDQYGHPANGAKVVNNFGDGTGELAECDSTGTVQFNFGASSAFSPPNKPPLSFYVVDSGATRDEEKPHYLNYKYKLSDVVFGGDTNGSHTEGNLTFIAQVLLPEATSYIDAIRYRAYPAKALTIPVYNPNAALQYQGRIREMGAVLSDEFYVSFGGVNYIAQGFAADILATIVGHYADGDFFVVKW